MILLKDSPPPSQLASFDEVRIPPSTDHDIVICQSSSTSSSPLAQDFFSYRSRNGVGDRVFDLSPFISTIFSFLRPDLTLRSSLQQSSPYASPEYQVLTAWVAIRTATSKGPQHRTSKLFQDDCFCVRAVRALHACARLVPEIIRVSFSFADFLKRLILFEYNE